MFFLHPQRNQFRLRHAINILSKLNASRETGYPDLESGARAYMMYPELYPNQKQWRIPGTGAL